MPIQMILSYKRKLKLTLFLILSLIILSGYSIYQQTKQYTTYVSAGKPILTGKTEQTYTQVESYSLPCSYIYDDSLYEDERVTVQEGSSGTKEVTILSTYYNGVARDHRVLDSKIATEATPTIVHIGTKKRPEYILPLDSCSVSSNYGMRWNRMHEGVDFATPIGSNVYASADGVVIRAETYGGYGLCIDIEHKNGSVTRYGHLSQINVSIGDTVHQGDIIADSGNTGQSTGPHLHFEIRINGASTNPLNYLPEF